MARFELQKLYIDGGYVDASSDATFEAINPANGEVLAKVQRATQADVERAVVSAEKGQKVWAAMTAMERSRILRRAVDILRERNDELAELETLDTGKAISETKYVDIVTGADVLEYYAGLVPAIEGEQIPLRTSSFVYTRREPLGVTVGIGAWNYPIQIALWKSAPALACGNAMILKPSERDPSVPLMLAALCKEAGLPDGVMGQTDDGLWLIDLSESLPSDGRLRPGQSTSGLTIALATADRQRLSFNTGIIATQGPNRAPVFLSEPPVAAVIGTELAKAIADAYLAQTFDENGRSAGNVQAINEVDGKYNAR